jgi:hypothetical protein
MVAKQFINGLRNGSVRYTVGISAYGQAKRTV